MKTSPQSFDVFAEHYDAVVSIERKHGFFLDHLPLKRRLALDVGCGSGLLSLELSRHFDRVVAVDISEPMLAIARRKRSAPNIEYRLCDVDEFSSDSRFDAIVSHTTLHHLPDIPATLAKLKRWLSPGGRMIIVDCIARAPAVVPRWRIFYRLHALMQFVPDMVRHGPKKARMLLRFRASGAWVAHLRSDRHFSPANFRQVFAASLPDARFTKMKSFMGVVWPAPTNEEKEPSEPSRS